jgi:hypothetical protein
MLSLSLLSSLSIKVSDLLRKLKVHTAQNDTNVTDILKRLVEDYLDRGESPFGAKLAEPSP